MTVLQILLRYPKEYSDLITKAIEYQYRTEERFNSKKKTKIS
jgi:hypothetical protein